MRGYRWYVNCIDEDYEPHEKTFNSFADCKENIKKYPNYPNETIGIDYIEDDEDGIISYIDNIQTPTKYYFVDFDD